MQYWTVSLSLHFCNQFSVKGSSSSSQAVVPPPVYLQESNAIDLSCLIAPPKRNSTSEAALRRVNVLNGVWPDEALVQYTTQRGAIKVHVLQIIAHSQQPSCCHEI
jgi:hypothetical protein